MTTRSKTMRASNLETPAEWAEMLVSLAGIVAISALFLFL
jgi:hypothetical protein